MKHVELFTGEKAHEVCNKILAAYNPESDQFSGYSRPENDTEVCSVGYWKEGDTWVAYDNSTYDCWVEEFATKKEASVWAMQGMYNINQVEV